MKKIILPLIVTVFSLSTLQAQTKVTKANVVGNWVLKAMAIENMLYYDIDKDSISLSKEMLEQLAASGADSASATEMMKGQFAQMKENELLFSFSADGKYSTTGNGKNEEKGTYTVDDATGIITLETPKDGKQEIKASFNAQGRLLFPMPERAGTKTTLEFSKK